MSAKTKEVIRQELNAEALAQERASERRKPSIMYTKEGGINLTILSGYEAHGPDRVSVYFPTRMWELKGEEARSFYNFVGDTRFKKKKPEAPS